MVNLPCRPAVLAAELARCGGAVVDESPPSTAVLVEGVPVAVMVAE